MTARAKATLSVLLGLSGVALAARVPAPSAVQQSPQQTFRTGADVVFVDVSVRRGGQPVLGLTAADFDLRDNGVRQQVESVEATAVPIDLTLIVDVSGPAGPLQAERGHADQALRRVNKDVERVMAILRPVDRLRVLAIDRYVHQLLAVRGKADVAPFARVPYGGRASAYDAILSALLQPVEPNRRHVIIAGVKLRDDASAVDALSLRDVASKSDALLHIVAEQTQAENEAHMSGFQCAVGSICQQPEWTPQRTRRLLTSTAQLTPDGAFLKQAAEATGGAWHQAVLVSEPTTKGTFERAFEDFRQSYVLRYTPQGVNREGWHSITVSVPSERGVTIQARRGYGVDAAVVPPTPNAQPRSGTKVVWASLSDVAAAWDRDGLPGVVEGLRSLPASVRLQFIEGMAGWANPWPGQPRREAVFALEFADAALGLSQPQLYRRVDERLERTSLFVRHPIEPDEFERAWLWAHVCLAEGRFWQLPAIRAAGRALARFPDDPRFILADAIAHDQRWRTNGTVGGTRLTSTSATELHVAAVTAKYRAAMAFPETRAEAHVRLAWLLHRIGRHEEALATLQAGPIRTPDADIAYLRHLFTGNVLLALNRFDAAAQAFEFANVAVPGAQSARVALMNAMTLKGDTASALRLATEIETAEGVLDPWWTYWFGDYRWYEQALDEVRRLAK